MIVRILHEGQYDIPGDSLKALKDLDEALMRSLLEDDERGYADALHQLLRLVRRGRPLPDDELKESDLVVPSPDFSLAEVRKLFRSV